MASGLSLLLVRPSILLSSLHHLVLSLAFTLLGQQPSDPSTSSALNQIFGDLSAARIDLDTLDVSAQDELLGELAVNQEVLDKVRGMESKLEYQIKKLSALAEAEEKRGNEVVDDVEEGELRTLLDALGTVC
jgi:U3 small nucleolar ribonucleoprotein protein LCP5